MGQRKSDQIGNLVDVRDKEKDEVKNEMLSSRKQHGLSQSYQIEQIEHLSPAGPISTPAIFSFSLAVFQL